MTADAPTRAREPEREHVASNGSLAVVLAALLIAALVGLLAPSAVPRSSAVPGMSMTHYMELLAAYEPRNLLVFMAAPVVLAETLAISELVILLGRAPRWVRALNHWAGLVAGPVMTAILVHLLRYAVLPLTATGGWRGWPDWVAVGSYLLGALPMIAISLLESGTMTRSARRTQVWRVGAVSAFLVVAHVAMIVGMLNPTIAGWGTSVR